MALRLHRSIPPFPKILLYTILRQALSLWSVASVAWTEVPLKEFSRILGITLTWTPFWFRPTSRPRSTWPDDPIPVQKTTQIRSDKVRSKRTLFFFMINCLSLSINIKKLLSVLKSNFLPMKWWYLARTSYTIMNCEASIVVVYISCDTYGLSILLWNQCLMLLNHSLLFINSEMRFPWIRRLNDFTRL